MIFQPLRVGELESWESPTQHGFLTDMAKLESVEKTCDLEDVVHFLLEFSEQFIYIYIYYIKIY